MFVCSNKYYCFLKKIKKWDVYPTLVACVRISVLIASSYYYKGKILLY